jgi:hypothetical protein
MMEPEVHIINIEALLVAEDLKQMTFKDRETLHEEIHGLDSILEETEELICTCFEMMEIELSKISEKPAYEEAAASNIIFLLPHFTFDDGIRGNRKRGNKRKWPCKSR